MLIDIIRLIRTENVGPITFIKLVETFGSPKNALLALPTLTAKLPNKPVIYSIKNAEEEIATAKKLGIKIITYLDPLYPPLLKTTEDFPPVLFVKGHDTLLKKSTIAIVGSRSASLNSRVLAFNFAKSLGEHGFLVSSGFAKGIDSAAHEGSLEKGTAAFLGGGVDVVYPKENKALYEKIEEYGVLISEFKIGTTPVPSNFPRRNRLIAGMSRAVLVIEATKNSGSLITAQIAIDINRDVFAVPTTPSDNRGSGTNQLIKEGAYLTETVDDILDVIKSRPLIPDPQIKENLLNSNAKQVNIMNTLDETMLSETKVFLKKHLTSSPISVDLIISYTKDYAPYVNTALLEMELGGMLERFPNNKVALIKSVLNKK